MSTKVKWRLDPVISQNAASGKRKAAWMLQKVTRSVAGEATQPFGVFDTIKAAREMAKHLQRKPIELR